MLLSDKQPITDVPVADYTFHAGGIISTLEDLLNTSGAWKDARLVVHARFSLAYTRLSLDETYMHTHELMPHAETRFFNQ